MSGTGEEREHHNDQDREDAEPEHEFDAEWLPPAILFLAARGARAVSEDGVWGWAALVLGILGAVVGAVVIVRAVRRRAYETLITVAVGALFMVAITHARDELF